MEQNLANVLPTNGWVAINRPLPLPSQILTEDASNNGEVATQEVNTVTRATKPSEYLTPPKSITESPPQKPRTPLPNEMPPAFRVTVPSTSARAVERRPMRFTDFLDNFVRRDAGKTSLTASEWISDESAARQSLEALFPPKEFWQPSDTELRANGKKVGRTGDIEKMGGHANAWAATLEALGLTAGDWPKDRLTLPNMAPHEGKAKSTRRVVVEGKSEKLPVCELPFIIYHILHRAPGQMLLLDQLFNITLAVVPNMNPKNASTRHCLSTHSEFKNVTEDKEGRTISGWTIATVSEFKNAEGAKREKEAERNAKRSEREEAHKRSHSANGESNSDADTRNRKMAKNEDVKLTMNGMSLQENNSEDTASIGTHDGPTSGSSHELSPEDLVKGVNSDEDSPSSRLNEEAKAIDATSNTEGQTQVTTASSNADELPFKTKDARDTPIPSDSDTISEDPTTCSADEREVAIVSV